MVFKHAVVTAFRIYAQCGEVLLKGEVGGHALSIHGNYIFDHRKSWNCVFEFLWEPCNTPPHFYPALIFYQNGYHQKPADLDLQCFQKRINLDSAGEGLTVLIKI